MTRKPRPADVPPPAIVVLPPGATEMEAQFYAKLAGIERQLTGIDAAVRSLMPMLEAIVARLETQGTPAPLQVASYEQLYREELDSDEATATETPPTPAAPSHAPGWWGRLFPRKGEHGAQ